MHDGTSLLRARIERLISQRLLPARYRARAAVTLTAWQTAGEPVPFAEATAQAFSPIANGDRWGTPWGTTWFHISGKVPASWQGQEGTSVELITDIGFTDTQTGFQCEGLAYAPDGRVLKAVEPFNRYVRLDQESASVDIFLEAASNPDVINEWTFVPTDMGRRETAGSQAQYELTEISLGLRDEQVCALLDDLRVLCGLIDVLPETSTRRARIFTALGDCLRVVAPDAVAGTASAGRATLIEVLSRPAVASAHTVLGVGHAHIDSAWLWPIRETARKVTRTFSNVLDLIEQNDEFIFAASSAQQYAWVKENYPEFFERLRAQVAAGRFVPVGGMWVESDTNLPGGEALARQFVHGSRFFRDEFGISQPEVWLPDSFGYSAALPQIMKLAGARWFLTQKISWNQVNRMPHHTFWWEGIDGSRIFTHFPPVDSYCSDLSAIELERAERQYAEKGHGTISLVPFGYGDGGGGPTREMLATAERTRDLEGSPRVRLGSPHTFFEEAQREYPDPPVWSGELYLEIHRGTFTSQARTKRGNRRSESLLRQAELWASTAAVRGVADYPYDALDDAWHTVLLYQFHDILPGTSIGWVHDEVESRYAEVAAVLEQIIQDSVRALAGTGSRRIWVNAGPFPVGGVRALAGSDRLGAPPVAAAVSVERTLAGDHIVTTPLLTVTVDPAGAISSLIDRSCDREAVAPGSVANQFQIFRDTPSEWDAWDIDALDRETQVDLADVAAVSVLEHESDRVVIRVERSFGSSQLRQDLLFVADRALIEIKTHIDWHEREKMLKLAFPLDVRAERATSEIQFGHIHRPLHTNTSWDVARFETPAHRWVHVGEPDYGFSVANDSVYGHDFHRVTRDDGGTTTQVRLSLLRAPLYPDPQSDQGAHSFTVALRVGAGVADAIADGYRLNVPLREMDVDRELPAILSLDNPAVVVEAVKLAEDRSGDVVVRLYESLGGRAEATLTANFSVHGVEATNLHEVANDDAASIALQPEGSIGLALRPFQILTLRLRPQNS